MKHYNKLIRDKIPDIIRAEGRKCTVEVLSDEDYLFHLNKKLVEEVNEYMESNDVEELADLEEVLRAILDAKNVEYDEFETVRKDKVAKRGAFKKKLLLKDTD
ncbi:MAG: nucleoside triphosphate pyrophosphohydrolase [Erysipelotrichaceae bacterium]|nr:nucleoside triphosphate pyrophosphohydrolase [Erysipelotrichaceae bacterium]